MASGVVCIPAGAAASVLGQVEELGHSECYALLQPGGQGHAVLQLGGTDTALFPVSYSLGRCSVVLRLGDDTGYTDAPLRDVAFHAYGVDGTDQSTWSIVARGQGRDVTDPLELLAEQLTSLLPSSVVPAKRRFIEIRVQELTGRRYRRPPVASDVARRNRDQASV